MKILVTGGAGYLGSILSRKLLAKGYKIRVIDALWYGKEPISECLSNPNFELIQDDIRNLVAVGRAIKGVDAVIHLASIVGMPASNLDPPLSEEINYLAAKAISELSQIYNINTLIFASTCSVYGSQPNSLITEKSTVSPLDYYAQAKFKCERALNWLYKAPTILRFGTLFGYSPRMRFDLVINLFMAKALNHEKLTVFGGNQYRPFLHVADAADSIVFALEKNLDGLYNVISENFTIMEAAERIRKLSGCEIEVSNDIVDLRDYKVSAEKIRQFGFTPTRNIEAAYEELKKAFEAKLITNYKEQRYSNYETLNRKKGQEDIVS